jgi:hypothetical protein
MAHQPIPDQDGEFTGTTATRALGKSYKISVINQNEVEAVWPFVIEHLERAVAFSDGEIETEDFLPLLLDEEMQLWVAVGDGECVAAMVTQVIIYPRKKILRVIAVGGRDMKIWMKNIDMLENFALAMGCTELEAWTKRGFLRVLKDWKMSHIVIKKDLKGRLH